MKNKIDDLRNHLFAQLERLGEDEMTPEDLQKEIDRAKAMTEVAQVIVNSAKVEVDFMKQIQGVKSPFFHSDRMLNQGEG
jgi:hypothetical protein